jgi:hypothetical protein
VHTSVVPDSGQSPTPGFPAGCRVAEPDRQDRHLPLAQHTEQIGGRVRRVHRRVEDDGDGFDGFRVVVGGGHEAVRGGGPVRASLVQIEDPC